MDLTKDSAVGSVCGELRETIDLIGDKWTIMVLMMLVRSPLRFNELRRQAGVSQQMLARTLKGLYRDGFLDRTVFPTVPPQVEYRLTPLGHAMAHQMRALAEWALEQRALIQRNRESFDEGRAKATHEKEIVEVAVAAG